MPVSEAKLSANRTNSLRSTGPKTSEGKAISRQNGLKHGLTGAGVVLAPDDSAEVERRHQVLQAELAPKTALGQILVIQMATLSVRMERGAQQEFAQVAARVRHAADDFDAERVERAEQLIAGIADHPRATVRKLRKSPEGIDCLIEAWRELRRDLTRPLCPKWTDPSLEKVAHLMGLRMLDLAGSELDALAKASWGNLTGLAESDKAGIAIETVKAWARARLIETVDAEIAALEAHFATLDQITLDQDRAEAGTRALFDPSREASLARRYESEARRGFFRALREFRAVESEVLIPKEVADEDPTSAVGSSRESRGVTPREPRPGSPEPSRRVLDDELTVSKGRNRVGSAVEVPVPVG